MSCQLKFQQVLLKIKSSKVSLLYTYIWRDRQTDRFFFFKIVLSRVLCISLSVCLSISLSLSFSLSHSLSLMQTHSTWAHIHVYTQRSFKVLFIVVSATSYADAINWCHFLKFLINCSIYKLLIWVLRHCVCHSATQSQTEVPLS